MKRIALTITLLTGTAYAVGPPALYFPKPHVVYDMDSGAMAVTMQPTSYGAMLVSPAGTGTDWTPMSGTAAASVQPNNYVGLLVCTANCASPYGQTWGPWTGTGGGGGSFSDITSGTNTTAAMVVGSGASLAPTGTGTINANRVNGAEVPASAGVLGSNGSSQLVAATSPQIVTALNTTPSSTLSPSLIPSSGSITYPVKSVYGNGNSYMYAIGATSIGQGQFAKLLQDTPISPFNASNVAVSGLFAEQIAVNDFTKFIPNSSGPTAVVENGVENNAENNACTVGASSNCITNFLQAQRFSITWTGLPKSQWIMASTGTPATGPWSGDSTYTLPSGSGVTGNPIKCSGTCSISFTIPATNNGHIFFSQITSNTNTGTYTITIGGVAQTNPCTGTTTFSSGPCGGQALLSATSPQANEFYNAAWSGNATVVTIATTNANNVAIIGPSYATTTLPANMNLVYMENGSPAFDPAPGYFSAASMAMVTGLGPTGSNLLAFPADVRTTETNFPGGCTTGSINTNHPNNACYTAIKNALEAAQPAVYTFTEPNSGQQAGSATGVMYAPIYAPIGFQGSFAAMHHFNPANTTAGNFIGFTLYDDGSNVVGTRFLTGTPLGGVSSSYYQQRFGPTAFADCTGFITNYATGAGTNTDCEYYGTGSRVQSGSQTASQFITSGPNPTIASAGTTTGLTISGTNMAGTITLVTGGTPATGDLGTITFSGTLTTAPRGCHLEPGDSATAALGHYVGAPSITTWTFGLVTAPTLSTTYVWRYSCGG